MSDADLIGGDVALERIERVLRGEDVGEPVIVAGTIPAYYGVATASDACDLWLRMWRLLLKLHGLPEPVRKDHETFYQAGAIGWASRP